MTYRLLVSGVLVVSLLATNGASQTGEVERRARPPRWDKLPSAVFFADAFRDGLRGPRPASLGASQIAAPADNPAVNVDPEVNPDQFRWSKLISSATIEDEVKRVERALRATLVSEGHFKNQGYRQARGLLGHAAMLFAIIQQYDGHVRWSDDANIVWPRAARSARNAVASSTQVFRDVKQRQQELFDLIRGGHLTPGEPATLEWPQAVDRALIMKRLDELVKQSAPRVGAAASIASEQQALVREAELIAAIARVLCQPKMEDASDDEYARQCNDLERAARRVVEASKQQDADQARSAHGDIRKSCDECHDLYRG